MSLVRCQRFAAGFRLSGIMGGNIGDLDSSSAAVNHAGTGSEQFPPPMMLALLLYSYSHGVFSSREIERSTYVDIGVRFVCGDTHPDHDTICRFRRANRDYIAGAFRESLEIRFHKIMTTFSAVFRGCVCCACRRACRGCWSGRGGRLGGSGSWLQEHIHESIGALIVGIRARVGRRK